MTFAKAFQKAKKKVEEKGEKGSIKIPVSTTDAYYDPEQVPRMYRAQVEGRCSLQFAGDRNRDLKNWVIEWVDPISEENPQPRYQRQEPTLGWDGSIYRLKIDFPWRVCSNCGSDSILRPILGKDGIPFFPGSSVKGLFRRLLNSEHLDSEAKKSIKNYCGSQDIKGQLRFHGAYPVGDWACTQKVRNQRTGAQEPHYLMVDVVHPQQPRQVEGKGNASAFTLITLFKPTLIFELSSTNSFTDDEWNYIVGLLRRALSQGLGGKTSTGYGLWVIPKAFSLQFGLQGVGVSSLLRNDVPEFRLNIFKACLRGHASRLLAGVDPDPHSVKQQVNKLFGHTRSPGCAQLYWEWKPENLEIVQQGQEKTSVYRIKGTLHLDICQKQVANQAEHKKYLNFLEELFKFAYVMGGFGKSWRRIWHKGPKVWEDEFQSFLPSYATRAIGCHWQYTDTFELGDIKNPKDLEGFLQTLYLDVQRFRSTTKPQCINSWRESWHPRRVAVFCGEAVFDSSVIELFHKDDDHPFKTTPAICGKSKVVKNKNGREEESLAFHVSSIWHRMLPIGKDSTGNEQYLEIVTVFHGDRTPWKRSGTDQLHPFIDQLTGMGLTLAWGSPPPP